MAGLLMDYDESSGFFKLNKAVMQKFNVTIPIMLTDIIATAKYYNVIEEIAEKKDNYEMIVDVPCNVVWHNAHRINPNKVWLPYC